jgi:hypothetical protein
MLNGMQQESEKHPTDPRCNAGKHSQRRQYRPWTCHGTGIGVTATLSGSLQNYFHASDINLDFFENQCMSWSSRRTSSTQCLTTAHAEEKESQQYYDSRQLFLTVKR